ncbi:unnamed protein product [Closterium sp. Yama58-4]|nr:unnamed protein product [Closterium sp. Yama58-4]
MSMDSVTNEPYLAFSFDATGCPSVRQVHLKPSLLSAKFSSGAKQSPVVRLAVKPRLVAVRAQAAGGESDGGKKQVEVSYSPQRRMEEYAQETDPTREKRGPGALTLFSPSKVNVFLRITRKRPDGYHELASLFHAISLGDTLKFSFSPSNTRDALTTNAPGVPLDSSNLVIKALDLFRRKTGIQKYFWVHLDKKVPTGAGLGGGSGNAATALWAANRMCGNVASEADLLEWSADIGSDISFFFSQGAAYCTGRGEIVEDVTPILPLDLPLVLMKPPEACSTADVYRKFRLDRASKEDPGVLLERVRQEGITQATCVNDLEPPAFEVLPSLKSFKTRVATAGRGRYSAVFMSGSGSTIVGVGHPDPPELIYDDDAYANVFVSEARFILRQPGDWYHPYPAGEGSAGATLDRPDAAAAMGSYEPGKPASGVANLNELKLPFSYEA